MANSHCDEEHIWGPIFHSGNVYCRHCGVLLGNVFEEGQIPGAIIVDKPRYSRLLTGIPMDPNPTVEINSIEGDRYPNGDYPDE